MGSYDFDWSKICMLPTQGKAPQIREHASFIIVF